MADGGWWCLTVGRHAFSKPSIATIYHSHPTALERDDVTELAVRSSPRRRQEAGGSPGKVDGRFLRTERTRQRIIESFLVLLRLGKDPTSNEIAAHAGCSVRSVFERFKDMAALRVAAADYMFLETRSALPDAVDGDRQARLQARIADQADNCERIMPLWRTMLAHQSESESLRQYIVRTRTAARQTTEQAFASEFATLPAEGRRLLLITLESVINIESWSHMREHYGLSSEEARAVWLTAVDRLLP